ncbi:MAG: RNA recognition motif domain-containing protein, partial [Spirochaetales bacterium]|nr:RNA recognition motif domain-containing protein [Spirochaetales bacterium]
MGKKRVFFSNLSYSAGESDIEALCKPFGTIVEISMKKSKKGTAVVEMESPEAAEKLINSLEGRSLLGREFSVGFELSKKQAKSLALQQHKRRTQNKKFSEKVEYEPIGPAQRRINEKKGSSPRGGRSSSFGQSRDSGKSYGSRDSKPSSYGRDRDNEKSYGS